MTRSRGVRMTGLRIPRRLLDDLDGHALSSYPEECCGAFLGRPESGHAAGSGRSALSGPRGMCIRDPERRDIPSLRRSYSGYTSSARQQGKEVLGYYHSHPDGVAVPSARDHAEAASGVSYLIVAVSDREVLERRSWRLRDDSSGFDEERLS